MPRLSFRALTTLTAALSACLLLAGPLRADNYLYDQLGNVRSRSNDLGTVTYTYDANTNRTSNGAPTGIATATFATNSNRLATINGVVVTPDAAGNLAQDGNLVVTWLLTSTNSTSFAWSTRPASSSQAAGCCPARKGGRGALAEQGQMAHIRYSRITNSKPGEWNSRRRI